MKLKQIIFHIFLTLLHSLNQVDKGGDIIYTKIGSDSLLIITEPLCYSYTPTDEFTILSTNIPSVSKGASLVKASMNDIILVGGTPFFLLHLDIRCSIIQRHDTSHQTEPNYPFKLSLLSTGEVITTWVFQSTLYFIKYNFSLKDFSVQTYSFSTNNSDNVSCDEISLNKLLCIYYSNNYLMFGLYNILTSELLDELSTNIDITQINTNGYLHKTNINNEIVYCIKDFSSQLICFNIKESNDTIELKRSVVTQNWFSWTNSHRLFLWELINNEMLWLSQEGTEIKTQRGFTDLTPKGSVYTYDFKHLIGADVEYRQEILFEIKPEDNTLLVLYNTKEEEMLKITSLSLGSLNDKLFIGLRPQGGEVNLGFYINYSLIIFYSLPSEGRFTDLNYIEVSLSVMYNVDEVIFQYDPIVNVENKVNDWEHITGTASSQGDSFDLGIFSHQKPVTFAYCYYSCDSCIDWGHYITHNCRDCNIGFYHLATNMIQCFNNQTRPENSFWDNELNYYNSCYGSCKTCHQRGDFTNNLCDSCKEPQYLQPKGDRNCVFLCPDSVRWYVDLDGNYYCTRKAECLPEYSYYNPTTNECLMTCSSNSEVYYQYECYSTCPETTFLDQDKGECFDYCPDTHAIDSLNKKCINCALINQLNYKRTCIDISSQPDNTYISNTEYNVLKDCFEDIITGVIKSYYGIIPECTNQCPLYHYYLLHSSTCNECYASCKTCFQRGSDDKNNCIECKDNYMSHALKKGMCISKCPLYWYIDTSSNDFYCTDNCIEHKLILNIEANECVKDCPTSKVIYNNQCLNECPNKNMIIHNYKCFPENSSQIEMEDDWRDIFDRENDSLNDYFNNLSDISPSIVTNDNFTIQVIDPKSESGIQEAIDNNLSLIDLGACEAILRQHYKIPDDKPLLIMKIDIKENYTALTPIVKYKVYDHEGNLLDLELCDNIKIEIEYPIINDDTIDLIKGKEFKDQGIDVYSKGDPFFNDICYPFSSSEDKDIPIQDRRDDIYQNSSFCQMGCLYQRIDFGTKRVSCQCDASINKTDDEKEITNEILGETFDLFDSSTIMVVTCYKLVFQLDGLLFNVGFWLFGFFTLVIVLTMLLFSCCGYIKLYAYLNQFPHKKEDDGNKNSDRDNKEIKKIPSAPSSKQRNGVTRLNIIPSYENGEYCISKDTTKKGYCLRRTQLESNDLLCTPKKNQKSVIDSTLSFHNTLCNNKTIAGMPTTYNTPVDSNKNLAFKSSLSKVSTVFQLPNEERGDKSNGKVYTNKTHSKALTVTPLKLEDEKRFNKPNNENEEGDLDYDSLEIEEAMIQDHRGLCTIYWSSIKTDQMIVSLFTNKSPFAPFLIRFNLFIFTVSLFFSMNALLFSEQQISTRYHSNEDFNIFYIIKNEFTKCLYASLITSLVTSVFMYLVSNYNIRKLIKETTDQDKFLEGIKKQLSNFKWKIYFFFIISLLVVLFCWYFVAAFCLVYANNRVSWIEGSLITFTLSNILGFALLFISSVFRFMANRMKWWCLFKVSLYVKDFAT